MGEIPFKTSLIFKEVLIAVWLIYNVVLAVSRIQQSYSVFTHTHTHIYIHVCTIYIYILFHVIFPYWLLQNIEYGSLGYSRS